MRLQPHLEVYFSMISKFTLALADRFGASAPFSWYGLISKDILHFIYIKEIKRCYVYLPMVLHSV